MSQSEKTTGRDQGWRSLFGSITTRLTVSFSLVFVTAVVIVELLGLGGVPFTTLTGRTETRKLEASQSLNLIADLKKGRLLRWLEERHDDASLIASDPFVKEGVARLLNTIRERATTAGEDAEPWAQVRKERSYATLLEFLTLARDTYDVYERIQIIDAQTGTVILATEQADHGTDGSHGSLLAEILRFPDIYASDIKAHHGPAPTFHVGRAIRGGADQIVAVLVMDVSVEDLIRPLLLAGKELGNSGEVLLINQDARIITSLNHPLPDGTTAEPLQYNIQAEPALRAARGEDGLIEAEDYRGVPVLAAYRHIKVSPEVGWGMVVKRDKADLLATVHNDIVLSMVTGLLGILTVVVLTIILARRLTSSILSLSVTAKKVADGDLSVRAPVAGSSEIKTLAATFNSMIRRLQQWHSELNKQVAERTAALTRTNAELVSAITKRTLAEGALDESERRYKAVFDSAAEGIVIADAETRQFVAV